MASYIRIAALPDNAENQSGIDLVHGAEKDGDRFLPKVWLKILFFNILRESKKKTHPIVFQI